VPACVNYGGFILRINSKINDGVPAVNTVLIKHN